MNYGSRLRLSVECIWGTVDIECNSESILHGIKRYFGTFADYQYRPSSNDSKERWLLIAEHVPDLDMSGCRIDSKDVVITEHGRIDYIAQFETYTVILSPERHYKIIKYTGQRCIYLAGKYEENLFPLVKRVTRQIITRANESKSALVLHCAALANASGAIVIMGKRGAGKTTTMMAIAAFSNQKWCYIANDRIFTWLQGGAAFASEWPSQAGLNLSMFAKSSPFRDFMCNCGLVSLAECRHTPQRKKKIYIHPDEMRKAFGASSQSVPIRAIFILTGHHPVGSSTISRVREEEAAREISSSFCHWNNDKEHPDWLGLSALDQSHMCSCADQLGKEIAARIPAYRTAASSDMCRCAMDIISAYDCHDMG